MRILIVGAGGIGGYFGGRLLEKGEDVTFLVREKRKQELVVNGLMVESVHGDMKLQPNVLLSGESADPFDVILLSTKSYHLQGAIEDIQPYVLENTMILPLLNGIAHIDTLIKEFGTEKVLGGLCFIETTLDEHGNVVQTSPVHDLVYGERSGETTDRILELQSAFNGTKTNFRLSETIEQEMWHKYLFITTLSGVTSLFRSPVGPIQDQKYAISTIKSLLQEVTSVMRSVDAPLADKIEDVQLNKILQLGANMKSSLQRDMEKGLQTEVEHFFGYLLQIANKENLSTPVMDAIYANLKIYESTKES